MGINRFNAGSGYAHYVGKDGASLEVLPTAQGIIHPFKIMANKSGGSIKVRVRAGTVNNKVPTIGGDRLDKAPPVPELTLSGDATHRIYINAAKGSTPVFFPETVTIVSDTSDKVDTDNNGYLLVGTVVVSGGKVTSVNQFVYASQVVVRAKPGDATALWLWSSR